MREQQHNSAGYLFTLKWAGIDDIQRIAGSGRRLGSNEKYMMPSCCPKRQPKHKAALYKTTTDAEIRSTALSLFCPVGLCSRQTATAKMWANDQVWLCVCECVCGQVCEAVPAWRFWPAAPARSLNVGPSWRKQTFIFLFFLLYKSLDCVFATWLATIGKLKEHLHWRCVHLLFPPQYDIDDLHWPQTESVAVALSSLLKGQTLRHLRCCSFQNNSQQIWYCFNFACCVSINCLQPLNTPWTAHRSQRRN